MVSISRITAPITNKAKTLYNKVPSVTVAKDKVIDSVVHIGKKWTSPQQRVIMGITALMTQPFIDARNTRVDDETRKASVAKTIAKIVVGTATGFVVRYACIKGIRYTSHTFDEIPKNTKPFIKKIKTLFTPKTITVANPDEISQYRNAMGTFVSLGIMLFSNFLIDAPWTQRLTNTMLRLDKQVKGEKQ